MPEPGLLGLAIVGGLLRVSPALLWATVGDCLTQRGGHFNLGLEGIVACGAMTAVLVAGVSGDPWSGVAAAAAAGGVLALAFCLCCLLPRVNELAVGISLLIAGIALARFVGEGLGSAPTVMLPGYGLDGFRLSALLPLGLLLAVALAWVLGFTRAGLLVTACGDRGADVGMGLAGVSPRVVRAIATTVGGMCGGVGGASLGLSYPGGWSDELTIGFGVTAVTLSFLAGTRPLLALAAALAFSALLALGPALQVAYGTGNYHLVNTLPYLLALLVLVVSRRKAMLKAT